MKYKQDPPNELKSAVMGRKNSSKGKACQWKEGMFGQCEKLATRKYGDHWFCNKHGQRDNHKEIIKERESTHGDFETTALIAQQIKIVIAQSPSYSLLRWETRESLDLIATKLARILSHESGQNVADNWDDIAGYAELAKRGIEE